MLRVICCYSLTATIKPNPRDWVGWGTTKDTFVWVEPSLDPIGQDLVRKQVVFRGKTIDQYYDSAEFYQLCYADSNDQVRGANYCLENHHLVITTQEQYNAQYLKSKDCVLKTMRELLVFKRQHSLLGLMMLPF
uniref:SKICH domain-containing protein n=1 Tax=Oncorhynchus kisutch TaxID=8019 RepID=A0A8C7IAG5_ONCKI